MRVISDYTYAAMISLCGRIEKDISPTTTKLAEIRRRANLLRRKLHMQPDIDSAEMTEVQLPIGGLLVRKKNVK